MIIAGKTIHETLATAIKACRRHLLFAAFFSFFVNLLYLTQTIYMLQVYNRVMPTNGLMTLLYISLMAAFAYFTLAALDNLRGRLMVRSGMRLDALLATKVMRHVLALPRQTSGPVRFQNAMRDFDQFKAALSGPGVSALFDVPWILIYVVLCGLLSPWLGLLCLGAAGAMALISWLQERATVGRLTQAGKQMAKAHAMQDQLLQRSDTIRALGMVNAVVTAQSSRRREGLEDGLSAAMSGNRYRTAAKFIRLIMQSAGLGVGTLLAIDHQISPGGVFAASLLISRSMSPIDQIITSWKTLVNGYNSFFELNDLFTVSHAERPVTALPAPQGMVQVEALSILNQVQRQYVLNQVSFIVKPGEILGVIGPSGAGKTTLARVLVGAENYDVGHVRFDGADRREWDSQRLASHIGYVPQDTCLFEGSIRDNICRFENLTGSDMEEIDAAVVQAARDADIHELILRLPNGYNTLLGPNGTGLSAGQAQLIALARALYRRPKVLVMDEPNSNMDGQGETLLIRALMLFRELGGSVIVIAHRAGVLACVDNVMILQGGRIQFYGTREEAAQAQARAGVLPDTPKSANEPNAPGAGARPRPRLKADQ
ncbi:type I secretion system permease/ATPase [Asticcacaulis solisilvae]|uniref:type I secretion system permease/ATPase n=1 Tax=Asticcacaulis solisilvae TaxID=1217274 RepID=UPI003FD6D4DF